MSTINSHEAKTKTKQKKNLFVTTTIREQLVVVARSFSRATLLVGRLISVSGWLFSLTRSGEDGGHAKRKWI